MTILTPEAQKVQTLKTVVGDLPVKDQEFAKSLVRQYQLKGTLSPRQWPWVDKLIDSVTSPAPEALPAKVEVSVGSFKKVIEMFKIARKHIKFPTISLMIGDLEVGMTLAGQSAAAPGTVNVTDGKPYGQNKWYGRVTPDGDWLVNLKQPERELEKVEDFLRAFAADPAKVAGEYGKLSGRCMFCKLKLTDEKSTAAGFGETCAKHYGLHDQWKAGSSVLQSIAQQKESV